MNRKSLRLFGLLLILTILPDGASVRAQDAKTENDFVRNFVKRDANQFAQNDLEPPQVLFDKGESAPPIRVDENEADENEAEKARLAPSELPNRESVEKEAADALEKSVFVPKIPIQTGERFGWKPALIQSGVFLGVQHGFRIGTQLKTRRELGGPFFRDWAQSAAHLRGWSDGNKFFTNYIGHPLQGSATGRIFINNSERARKQEFGKSKEYWQSRFKAMLWSTAWSTQFELGPLSEATLGNVGKNNHRGRSLMAWVDLVLTPTAGTGLLIGEDAIDKYVLKNWLEKNSNGKTTAKIRIARTFLTPTISVGNLLRGKRPWKRDNR